MSCISPEDTRARITKVLDDSVSCALDLKVILDDERKALEERDTVALDTAATSKLAFGQQICGTQSVSRRGKRESRVWQ